MMPLQHVHYTFSAYNLIVVFKKKTNMEKSYELFDVQFEDAFMCAGTSCTSDPPRVATVVSGKFDLMLLVNTR